MSMEIDFTLMKKILQDLRQIKPGGQMKPSDEIEEYHYYLLKSSNLIDAFRDTTFSPYNIPTYNNIRLTSDGMNFLNAMENEDVWRNAKIELEEKGMQINQIPLDILKKFLYKKYYEYLGI